MKKALTILILISGICFPTLIIAQDDAVQKGLDAITIDALKGQLEFLASDWTEGRATAEKGIFLAGDYISSLFKVYGIKPAGDSVKTKVNRQERMEGKKSKKYRSYFQDFSLVEYSPSEKQEFSLSINESGFKSKFNFKYKTDFSVRTSDVGIEINAPVVFVGYGFVNEKEGYNDLDDVDIKGKVILRLPGFPGHKDTSSSAYKKFHLKKRWAQYYMNRDKNKNAKKYGAAAIIEVDLEDDVSKKWYDNYPFRYNTPFYEGDKRLSNFYDKNITLAGDTLDLRIPTIYITNRVLNKLIEGSGINFSKFEKYAQRRMKPNSKAIKGRTVYLKTNVDSKIVKCRNVLGLIEGENPDEVVVIGGHYDHIGKRDGYIWNGADDNGSGTVGVMTVAKACLATGIKPKKTIVFAAWTGEEMGLLGSRYFVSNLPFPINNVHVYINLDMISRSAKKDTLGNKLTMSFTEDYKQLEEINKKHNDNYDLNLDFDFKPSERPSGGSDHSSFSKKDIPVFFLITGLHEDYHTPLDHIDKVEWDKFQKLVKLSFLDVWELANMEGRLLKSSE